MAASLASSLPRVRSASTLNDSPTTSVNARGGGRCATPPLSVRRSCVKRARREGGARGDEASRGRRPRGTVAFAVEESVVIGRADAEVDRTPRGEPVKCTCCALHIVGYAFECLACAGERAEGEATAGEACRLCAVCFSAHAQLHASPATVAAHGLTHDAVHRHPPMVFVRSGEEDQMMLDEILRDRRELMVNGGETSLRAPTCSERDAREPSAGSDDSEVLNYCGGRA